MKFTDKKVGVQSRKTWLTNINIGDTENYKVCCLSDIKTLLNKNTNVMRRLLI